MLQEAQSGQEPLPGECAAGALAYAPGGTPKLLVAGVRVRCAACAVGEGFCGVSNTGCLMGREISSP